MSTRIDVLLEPGSDEGAVDGVVAAFRAVENTANEWRDGSPLAEVNRRAGEPVPAPAELREILRRALTVAGQTDGAFDPTWAALWGLWDFDHPRVPSMQEVESRLPHIGWARVVLDDAAGTVLLPDPDMRLGLGGIAKGWALDRAANDLRARGIDDFLLSAGGQVLAGGMRDGRPWRVGIRDPRGSRNESLGTIEVTDQSVSTSGDYERYFELDGQRWHHILDPRTGMPSRGAQGATVVCADGTTADAWSTALMVLGQERGFELLSRQRGIEAALIDELGTIHTTPGLKLRLTPPLTTAPPP
jgi:thiamine biosynthesis lipoprotein